MAKGLPTLPVKLVEKVWNKQHVDMEEFLPIPHSLRLAGQTRTSSSLQETLIGALSQFHGTTAPTDIAKARHGWVDMDKKFFTVHCSVVEEAPTNNSKYMVMHMHNETEVVAEEYIVV